MSYQFLNYAAAGFRRRLFAVQDFTTGVSTTGNQDVTTATLSGLTPKAVLTLSSYHDPGNNPNESPYVAELGIGLIDDAGNEFATFAVSVDGGTSTEDYHGTSASVSILINGAANLNRKVADGTIITDGCRYNFTTSNTRDMQAAFMAFAGTGVSAQVGSVSLGTGTTDIDVASVGFQPDVVIGMCSVTGSSHFHQILGVATSDGTQRCVLTHEQTSQADGKPLQSIITDIFNGRKLLTDGSLTYYNTLTSFDASGFTVTRSASAGSDIIRYLALKLDGGNAKIVDLTTPTSTGNFAITGVGFQPTAAIVFLTNLETTFTHSGTLPSTSDDLQGGLAIGLIADESWAASIRMNSGEATADTATQFINNAVIGASATDCDAIIASLVSWDSDGATFNFSAVQAAGKKGFILFMR